MGWLSRLFGGGKETEVEKSISYEMAELNYLKSDDYTTMMQEREDRDWDFEIERGAQKMLFDYKCAMDKQYLNWVMAGKPEGTLKMFYFSHPMLIPPLTSKSFYTIYNQEKARYKDKNIHDLTCEKYSELLEAARLSGEIKTWN